MCCSIMTSIAEELTDDKIKISTMIDNKDEPIKHSNDKNGKYFNYLRLRDGECYNCSTYKCTDHKSNMGGSEWCIMLFSDALAHCNSDSNCGGYTMTTAEWFHKKYDKNGQVAVHLSKHGEKSIPCLLTEWSSYEKQNQTRRSPVLYGKSTCENTNEDKCYNSENFNYEFVSKSNVVEKSSSYLCSNHRNRFDNNKDMNCILSIVDAVSHCNSDNQCEGFMINTDENWQKKYLNNGMQVVQLFGKDTM
ncbi:unnamed protein product [Rotaria socialis]|uniref:Uncharacterized protein n=2 Tax=Rotaria socialis TaxID=392032 RepID=A0A817X9J0_9BILA|nr:unnamed protein product [Rotaria socialis]